MKIAMIGQKGIPATYGGVERHVDELSKELAKQGHEILVYARSWYCGKMAHDNQGIKIIHTPTLRTKHLDTFLHTLSSTIHALKQKPDVMHYHGVGPALLSWIPRLVAPKTKVVVTFHSLDRYQYKWGFIAKMILNLGEYFACLIPHQTITVSRVLYNYCLCHYKKTTNYIPNGVRLQTASESALEKWNILPGKYLLTVSRFIKDKNIHCLIEAWKIVRQQSELLQDYKLVITGGNETDKKYVDELLAMAGDDNSIIFTGWQHGAALNELYANTALFVHPSENEGLPLSVLEAMSFGRPVLVSDIAAHQELIHNHKFWFNTANTHSLAEKIIELMSANEQLNAAGTENKRIAEKEYDWKDIARKTLETYGAAITGEMIPELGEAKI